MKERGLIFSGPMVRANLEGRKTQTRRVIKLPDAPSHLAWQYDKDNWFRLQATAGGTATVFRYYKAKCPYGVVGDRFYIREMWATDKVYDEVPPSQLPEDAEIWLPDQIGWKFDRRSGRARPSIHMPKWAARPERFEITDIRVERVQDISEEDAIAEGLERVRGGPFGFRDYEWLDDPPRGTSCGSSFSTLWDSINAKRKYTESDMGKFPADYRPYSWQNNPWVWAISYRKL